jgi:hypothetical protein
MQGAAAGKCSSRRDTWRPKPARTQAADGREQASGKEWMRVQGEGKPSEEVARETRQHGEGGGGKALRAAG